MDIIEAIERDNLISVKKLLKDGINPNMQIEEEPLLVFAIKQRASLEVIKAINEAGGDIFYSNEDGVSVLDEAIGAKNLELVKFLVNSGVDVNSTKRLSGFTPLMLASSLGSIDIVRFLLENGVNKEVKDKNNLTALEYATRTGQNKIIPLLG